MLLELQEWRAESGPFHLRLRLSAPPPRRRAPAAAAKPRGRVHVTAVEEEEEEEDVEDDGEGPRCGFAFTCSAGLPCLTRTPPASHSASEVVAPPQKRIRLNAPGGAYGIMRDAMKRVREVVADAPRRRILQVLQTIVEGMPDTLEARVEAALAQLVELALDGKTAPAMPQVVAFLRAVAAEEWPLLNNQMLPPGEAQKAATAAGQAARFVLDEAKRLIDEEQALIRSGSTRAARGTRAVRGGALPVSEPPAPAAAPPAPPRGGAQKRPAVAAELLPTLPKGKRSRPGDAAHEAGAAAAAPAAQPYTGPRLQWTPKLRKLFKDAVEAAGGLELVTPATALRWMSTRVPAGMEPPLTRAHVKSHLQACRNAAQ
jgi:SHAQKYF class myb-like DNA-binding protein